MRERTVEKVLRTEVVKHGGRAYKWVSPGNTGVPDRIVFLKGVTFFVEPKAPGKKLRPNQEVQRKTLAELGFEVHVLDTPEKVRLWVELQASCLERLAQSSEAVN